MRRAARRRRRSTQPAAACTWCTKLRTPWQANEARRQSCTARRQLSRSLQRCNHLAAGHHDPVQHGNNGDGRRVHLDARRDAAVWNWQPSLRRAARQYRTGSRLYDAAARQHAELVMFECSAARVEKTHTEAGVNNSCKGAQKHTQ